MPELRIPHEDYANNMDEFLKHMSHSGGTPLDVFLDVSAGDRVQELRFN